MASIVGFALALPVALPSIPGTFSLVVTGLLFSYVVTRGLKEPVKLPIDVLAAVGLALVAFGSQVWTVLPDASDWTALLYLCAALAIVSFRALAIRPAEVRVVLRWLAGGGSAAALTVVLFGASDPITGRISVWGANSNNVSYGVAIGFASAVLMVYLGRTREKAVMTAVAVLSAWAIYLTDTRGAIVAVALAVALGLARKLPTFSARLAAGLAGLCAWIALAYAVLAAAGWADLGWLTGMVRSRHGLVDAGLNGRQAIWELGLAEGSQHPWLGIGAGSCSLTNPLGFGAHNVFLTVKVDLGFLGLALLALMLGSLLWATASLAPVDRLAALTVFFVWLPIALTGVIETNPAWYGLLALMPAVRRKPAGNSGDVRSCQVEHAASLNAREDRPVSDVWG